VAKYEKLMEQ